MFNYQLMAVPLLPAPAACTFSCMGSMAAAPAACTFSCMGSMAAAPVGQDPLLALQELRRNLEVALAGVQAQERVLQERAAVPTEEGRPTS